MYPNNQLTNINQEEEKIDIAGLFQKALSKWYIFLFFGMIGVAGAYLYIQADQQIYQVETTLLIQNNEKGYDISHNILVWMRGVFFIHRCFEHKS